LFWNRRWGLFIERIGDDEGRRVGAVVGAIGSVLVWTVVRIGCSPRCWLPSFRRRILVVGIGGVAAEGRRGFDGERTSAAG
jgi:hypothetical protein